MKKFAYILSLFSILLVPAAFASHPHQAVCVVNGQYSSGDSIQFLLQMESAREYVNGHADQDVHDYRYQVRVCDDDNDSPQCSTYESKALSHGPTDQVTLVGMKDKDAVFFDGKFNADGTMEGKILQTLEKDGQWVKVFVPFKIKLDSCMSQSWVELKPEADSNAF